MNPIPLTLNVEPQPLNTTQCQINLESYILDSKPLGIYSLTLNPEP
jgi:hypothetical protein